MGMGGEICCLLILQMNTINSCEYIPSTSKILIRKKSNFKIEFATEKKSQADILRKAVSLSSNLEKPFFVFTLFTPKPLEQYQFVVQLVEILKKYLNAKTKNFLNPEFKIFLGEEKIYIHMEKNESVSFQLLLALLNSAKKKFPEYQFDFKINAQLGINFKDMITNHSEHTIEYLLDGAKVNLEFTYLFDSPI